MNTNEDYMQQQYEERLAAHEEEQDYLDAFFEGYDDYQDEE